MQKFTFYLLARRCQYFHFNHLKTLWAISLNLGSKKEKKLKFTRTANLNILRESLFLLRIFGVNYWQTTSPPTFLYPGTSSHVQLHMYTPHPCPSPMVRQRPCLSPPSSTAPPLLLFYYYDGLNYLETSKECILCQGYKGIRQ